MSDEPHSLVPSRRIAFVLPNMAGGGAERVALALVTDLVKRGHDIDLVLIEASGELLSLLPPQVVVVDLKARRIMSALPALIRYLRDRQPDAVHAMMWPVTIMATIAHRLARSPAIMMLSDHVAYSNSFLTPRQLKLLRWTTALFYPLADHRIVVSEGAAKELARLSGIPRDRFEVVYNPILRPARIASTPEVERLWEGTGARIITVGSLKQQKNHALLFRAVARMRDRSARLMILGEGHLRPQLDELISDLGIANRVIMPGFSLNPWPYFASADVFVLSSDYEGFPLVLAEAMHAGLRIVSTDCESGPAEMLDGGRYGRLVPCGDPDALAEAMDQALATPNDSRKIRRRAAELTGSAVFDRYAELLTA